ncbi:MAG: dihydrofolate reductase [Bacteroidales bacterium]|nr:dihydrofolate reductase [Bacteroidales bacterium]
MVSAIVATARNLVIGHENQIPWYLPADLKYFKKMTTGHHVIMGRKSFQSIGRPLPNRTNVIITRDLFFVATGCTIVHSLEEALELAEANGETEAFIIGGGEIYHKSWPYLDRLYLTEVDTEPEGDVFFPAVNEMEWRELSSEAHPADEKNEFGFVFRILERV